MISFPGTAKHIRIVNNLGRQSLTLTSDVELEYVMSWDEETETLTMTIDPSAEEQLLDMLEETEDNAERLDMLSIDMIFMAVIFAIMVAGLGLYAFLS